MYYEKPKNKIYSNKNQYKLVCLEQLVLENHLLRKVENAVDFNKNILGSKALSRLKNRN
jgi:hypothetical protein